MVISKQEMPQYLKQLRGTKTQTAFAEELGLSKQNVWQYENGLCLPSDETLAKLGIQPSFSIPAASHEPNPNPLRK